MTAIQLPRKTQAVLDFIISHKQTHDGNAPAMEEMAQAFSLSKSQVSFHLHRLEQMGLITRSPGDGRSIQVAGSQWTWAQPQPYPDGRSRDVLHAIIQHKQTHNGNAPARRELVAQMGIQYSTVTWHLSLLEEQGFIRLAYAVDRGIEVVGGQWIWDEAAMWDAYQGQLGLL